MLATAPAPDILTDPPFANHQRLQDDALQTIHKVMLYLAQGITGGGGGMQGSKLQGEDAEDDPAQTRTTTQRIRLCLQAAREILRFDPPAEAGEAPGPSPSLAGRRCPSPRGRMRVPHATQQREAEPEANHRGLQDRNQSLSAHPTPPTTTLLAAAGAGVPCDGRRSRLEPEDKRAEYRSGSAPLGDRLSPSRDSSLIAHTSPAPAPMPAPSSVRSASSVFQSSSAPPSSVPPVVKPPLPPRPQYFTKDETEQILDTMRSGNLLTPALYARIQEWNAYAIPADLSPAFGITLERLETRNPHNPANQRAAPAQ